MYINVELYIEHTLTQSNKLIANASEVFSHLYHILPSQVS